MRTGLVVVGLALAIVGAGVTVSGFLLPDGAGSSQALVNSISAPNLADGEIRTAVIPGTNSSTGTLEFTWSATHSIAVAVYQGVPCSAASHYCISGSALANWPANSTGAWNRSGALTFPYLLSMQNSEFANATLRGSVAESFTVQMASVPTWTLLLILAGGVLLVAIGALAVFLGLFLRSGVYTEPEHVTPRYAHELAKPGDPLDEPFEPGPGSDGRSPPAH